MRAKLAAGIGICALAVPATSAAVSATRSTTNPTAKKTVTRKVSGAVAQADRWGTVQINVTARITIAGRKTTIHYTDLGGSYHTDLSQFIMSQALPLLRQEFLNRQSANIQNVSGATYTSQAFEQSLQSALLKLR